MRPRVRISRSVEVPDELRLARHRRAPELGSRILFLSGGTALRELSRVLKGYTHNSVHLITPFDSGGSSAVLRGAFDMLSVGDLRNRMMALADETVLGNPEIYRLFGSRLPKAASAAELRAMLTEMVEGAHPLVAEIPGSLQRIVRTHLRTFVDRMPEDFDLRGASLGNLVLAAGYLGHDRDIDSVIFLFSKLVAVLGHVRPTLERSLHLSATLADGSVVIGQHLLTGKEVAPLRRTVRRLELVATLAGGDPGDTAISARTRSTLREAELVCFPPGSFWTSVVANLLPSGVGSEIVENDCPKVWVPNLGHDPEELGLGVEARLRILHEYAARDAGGGAELRDVVRHVLVDTANGDYAGGLDLDALRGTGLDVIDVPLVTPASRPLLDPELLAQALLSLG